MSTLQTQSVHTPEGTGASLPLTCPSISYLKLCEWMTEKEKKIKKGNTEEKEERTERVLDIHACSYLQNCRAWEAPGFTVQTRILEFRKAPHLITGATRERVGQLTSRTPFRAEPQPRTFQGQGVPFIFPTQGTRPKPAGPATPPGQSITKEVCDLGQQVGPAPPSSQPRDLTRRGRCSAVSNCSPDTEL